MDYIKIHNLKSYILREIPGVYEVHRRIKVFRYLLKWRISPFLHYPPGHYYSCLPEIDEILAKSQSLFDQNSKECPGIDLREESQMKLFDHLSDYYHELPFPETSQKTTHYYYQNWCFRHSDAVILYSFLRHYRPRNVIEVGSGFSSALMLDVNNLFFQNSINFTFIEPYPDRLFSIVNQEDRSKHTVIQKPVQDVSSSLFQSLRKGDILFIDSSHVVKIGSDVAHIFFHILPRLNPGVIIHFHDIRWPFEYPKEAFLNGIAWNEAYFLRSFLQFNNNFEIMYFNSFMAKFHSEAIERKMPLCLMPGGGSSLWIRKVN